MMLRWYDTSIALRMLTIGVLEANGPATVIARFHVLRHGTYLMCYDATIRLVPIVLPQHSRFNLEMADSISVQLQKQSSIF